jgi:hypothetical protein|tara:strand:- start:47 stop:421 length:375 start_codon:yes stop_codon:yes gene_type:complete
MKLKERLKKWCTVDHCVDVFVDISLLIFDVISSPVLIVVRLIRYAIGEWVTDKVKTGLKKIVGYFQRKRAYRLKHGYGLFRTYWFLIITSPIIFTGLLYAIGLVWGVTEGIDYSITNFENTNVH